MVYVAALVLVMLSMQAGTAPAQEDTKLQEVTIRVIDKHSGLPMKNARFDLMGSNDPPGTGLHNPSINAKLQTDEFGVVHIGLTLPLPKYLLIYPLTFDACPELGEADLSIILSRGLNSGNTCHVKNDKFLYSQVKLKPGEWIILAFIPSRWSYF